MPTAPSRKRDAAPADVTDQEMREQEVLRANRELAAYFRGLRTEREARGALKIIKAFIRDRERVDPNKRRPLPAAVRGPKVARKAKKAAVRRKPRRAPVPAAQEPVVTPHE
jgi:hypothetical protein